MAKDDAVRIADTIAFIRDATVPQQYMWHRDTVADMLREREDAGTISTLVSPALSQGHDFAVFHRDEKQTSRHYRRAIALIRMLLQGGDPLIAPGETAQISDADLPLTLGTCLSQVVTTLKNNKRALELLKTNPLGFLTNNALDMASASESGVTAYWFYYYEPYREYKFEPVSRTVDWVTVREDVYHLDVISYQNLTRIDLPQGGGPAIVVLGNAVVGADLMVTTQLTGCSIVYYLNGGMLVAAHVQPKGARAEQMCQDLRSDAVLHGAPNQRVTGVFGAQAVIGGNPNDYQLNRGANYCIGVRSGAWNLFAQARLPGGGGPGTAWRIA